MRDKRTQMNMNVYQVTLDIALLWSAEIGRITILLT